MEHADEDSKEEVTLSNEQDSQHHAKYIKGKEINDSSASTKSHAIDDNADECKDEYNITIVFGSKIMSINW